jgi:hypothetical protein
VKVESVRINNHRRAFEVTLGAKCYPFPFARAQPTPQPGDPVIEVEIDDETAREGFVYRLESGAEGFVHGEQALEYNKDPEYMRELLLFKLTVEAKSRIKASGLSHRELIRRLGTSPAQFYRLTDTTNRTKSVDSMLALLALLECDVEFVVHDRTA